MYSAAVTACGEMIHRGEGGCQGAKVLIFVKKRTFKDGKEKQVARERLKEARKKAGMTQQEVADRLGIGLRYYQKIEAGERTGDFEIWDSLEDIFNIHQRKLREFV